MKPRSIMDGDLGFTMDDRQDGGYAIWLTVVAGVVIPEPALVFSSDSQRDAYAVFRALNAGIVSAIESAGMVAALRMADNADAGPDYSDRKYETTSDYLARLARGDYSL